MLSPSFIQKLTHNMATNNIKPFATDSSANIYTDAELAGMSELQTGF